MKSLAALLWIAALPAFAIAAPADPSAKALEQAIARFHAFDDRGASQQLRALLDRSPPRAIEAKAHIYLGIIAMNWLDEETAREEFHKAVLAKVTVELPADASPKVELVFRQAFADVQRVARKEAEAASPESLASSPVPAASDGPLAVAATPEAQRGSSNHWLSIALAGAAVASAVVAVYGGAQVVSYQGLAGRAVQSPGNTGIQTYRSALSSAQFWQYGWVGATVLCVGLGGTAVLVW